MQRRGLLQLDLGVPQPLPNQDAWASDADHLHQLAGKWIKGAIDMTSARSPKRPLDRHSHYLVPYAEWVRSKLGKSSVPVTDTATDGQNQRAVDTLSSSSSSYAEVCSAMASTVDTSAEQCPGVVSRHLGHTDRPRLSPSPLPEGPTRSSSSPSGLGNENDERNVYYHMGV